MFEEYKYVFIGCTIVTIIVGIAFNMRLTANAGKEEPEQGCMGVAAVFVCLWVVTLGGLGGTIVLASKLVNKAETIYYGDKYVASVVSYETKESYDEESGRTSYHYKTILGFKTQRNEPITYPLSISNNKPPEIGKLYEVYYNEATGITTTFSLGSLALILLLSLVVFLVLSLFLGMVAYCIKISIPRVVAGLNIVFFVLYAPLLMFILEGAILYRLFVDGNDLKDERMRYIFLSIVLGSFILWYFYVLINRHKYKRKYGGALRSYIQSKSIENVVRDYTKRRIG
ncbi:hypothetical protein HMPREF9713_02362 [Myroides odoratimimus CCUG 12700]|uniref:hypothetical protein n=1 Tax=Myroides odoratimimus TaxID=76832 RepID=UPI000353FF69|nr:hypothetical protein [Myroides odoratimimus]EPH10550.1 hypothetical protein HMPREF9713_02362 [Myroides odoratimimus CCUG 12700]